MTPFSSSSTKGGWATRFPFAIFFLCRELPVQTFYALLRKNSRVRLAACWIPALRRVWWPKRPHLSLPVGVRGRVAHHARSSGAPQAKHPHAHGEVPGAPRVVAVPTQTVIDLSRFKDTSPRNERMRPSSNARVAPLSISGLLDIPIRAYDIRTPWTLAPPAGRLLTFSGADTAGRCTATWPFGSSAIQPQ